MRFRFTIRDLLWLTLVVGLAVAWYQCSRLNSNLSLEAERVYPGDATFRAVDADTQMALIPNLRVSSKGDARGWPKAGRVISGSHVIEYQWVGIDPIELGISSNGYEEQLITVNGHRRSTIVLELHKLKSDNGSRSTGQVEGN